MKDDYIRIRLTEDEKKRIEEVAEYHGLTVSALVRMLVLEEDRKIKNPK